ncbi:hypothetical protein K7X08_034048 [Anisodus acutangulus]|uniref:Protein BIG GRAIN 1-like A n=1 Tax=Anisodus acutangulus TaxID=402998 RepID=A0A9Q1MIX2_9SOLA|nr:hypothetical protein K7X08_034048 [Anisodus acutangulus]
MCRKNNKNPSFSSTLLDEIYRPFDGIDETRKEMKIQNRKISGKKYSSSGNSGVKAKAIKKGIEDEELETFERTYLVEKWMENKVKDKKITLKRPSSLPETDNDPQFSSSSSSDSSCSVFSYSSESSRTKSKCSELYLFDDYQNQKTGKCEESLIKSKCRAMKIYANLKKMKQPISPGGRLSSFINSLFTNRNGRKPKTSSSNETSNFIERNSKSTCSSASSFSRSCLRKIPPSSNGVKRRVTFNPVGVIVDEDCRPCGHKHIYDHDSTVLLHNRKFEATKSDASESYLQHKKQDYVLGCDDEFEEEDDDDGASDASSDLFEIDHLAFLGDKRFCDELPVYETTHLDINRAIASGFVH